MSKSEKVYAEMSDDELLENAELGRKFAASNRRNGNHQRADEFERGAREDEQQVVHRGRLRILRNLRNL